MSICKMSMNRIIEFDFNINNLHISFRAVFYGKSIKWRQKRAATAYFYGR